MVAAAAAEGIVHEVMCPCGRSTKVQDEAAAARGRCADCGRPLVAAATDGVPAEGAKRPCPQCGEQILSVAKKCRFCGAFLDKGLERSLRAGDGDAHGRDIQHERHVRAIAVWLRIAGWLLLIMAIVGVMVAQVGGGRAVLGDGGLAIFGGLGVAYLALGHFLGRYSRVARLLVVLLLVLGAFATLAPFALGSAGPGQAVQVAIQMTYTAACLWALISPPGARVFEPSYQRLVLASPSVRVAWWTSPFFIVPLAVVGLIFGAGVLIGVILR